MYSTIRAFKIFLFSLMTSIIIVGVHYYIQQPNIGKTPPTEPAVFTQPTTPPFAQDISPSPAKSAKKTGPIDPEAENWSIEKIYSTKEIYGESPYKDKTCEDAAAVSTTKRFTFLPDGSTTSNRAFRYKSFPLEDGEGLVESNFIGYRFIKVGNVKSDKDNRYYDVITLIVEGSAYTGSNDYHSFFHVKRFLVSANTIIELEKSELYQIVEFGHWLQTQALKRAVEELKSTYKATVIEKRDWIVEGFERPPCYKDFKPVKLKFSRVMPKANFSYEYSTETGLYHSIISSGYYILLPKISP